MKKDSLLNPDELAQLLGISHRTVIKMAREHRVPCIRIGRLVRFDADEIKRWIERNKR